MSVLSNPRGRPDAVYALLRLVAKFDRPPADDDLVRWMVPAALDNDGLERARGLLDEVGSCAADLGFFPPNKPLAPPESPEEWPSEWAEFADRVHDRLCVPPPQGDLSVIDVYAAMVVKVERIGFDWLHDQQDPIADALRDLVQEPDPAGETSVFNSTRWLPWTQWMFLTGLGLRGTKDLCAFLPHPADRLGRVARSLPALADGEEVDAPTFLAEIGRAMPYLDGGSRYEAAWFRARDRAPEGRLSRVITNALRDLHHREEIELRYAGGDDVRARRLSDDGGEPSAFTTIRLGPKAVA